MMNRETSKIYLFQYLAPIVKAFVGGAQFQKVQAFRGPLEGEWAFLMDFYPAPRSVLLLKDYPADGRVSRAQLESAGFKLAESPAQLYVKAHLLNHRVETASLDSEAWEIRFSSGGVLRLRLGEETLEVAVPERKIYRQKLRLAAGPPVDSDEAVEEAAQEKPAEPIADPATRKYERLREKIALDLRQAEDFLEQHQEIFGLLQSAPQDWGKAARLSPGSMNLIHQAIKKEKIPRFDSSSLGAAQDYFFQQRRRMQRKVEGAKERLAEIEKANPYRSRALAPQPRPAKAARLAAEKKKHPGLRLTLDDGLTVYVGRSAAENAELFRKMKDRDLWFHVRAEKGAHVWIPRGQTGFPKKGEPSQKLLELGAQIALFNSRAERAGSATVDYTERRYLRSVPGEEGLLRIERSDTLFVRKDEALEKRLFAGR
jgi:hypothetical protein